MSKGDEALERANKILEAVMVYYKFFIPTHSDGRTVAEYLGIRPPDWLLPLVTAHREAEVPFYERKIIEDDLSHFIGTLSCSMIKDIVEDGGKSGRSKVGASDSGRAGQRGRREEKAGAAGA